MTETSKEAIAAYFDDLLGEALAPESPSLAVAPPVPAASARTALAAGRAGSTTAPVPSKNASSARPLALAQVAHMDTELKALEENKKQQLQILLNSHLLAPTVAPTPTPTSIAVPTPASVAQDSPVKQSVVIAQPTETPLPAAVVNGAALEAVVHPYLAWAENGRPVWAQKQFDVLLFQVGGLTLAVPLIALGQIYPLTDDLTPLFGQIDWFMGFQPTSAGAIRTVNTALFVMPERYDPQAPRTAKYVVTIDGMDWGLAVDAVRNPSTLQPEDVTWRSQRSKRPWLAGTVKSAMCALIDIPQMGQQLQSHDRNRISRT